MKRTSKSLRGVVVLLAAPVLGAAQSSPPAKPPVAAGPTAHEAARSDSALAARLELRIDPLMSLHAWFRKMAEGKGDAPEAAGAAEALVVVRRIGDELGGGLGWGIVDSVLVGSSSAGDLAKVAAELPESLNLFGGGKLPLRAGVAELAAAYGKLEPWFLQKMWPEWKVELERQKGDLDSRVLPKLPLAWADVGKHLDLTPPAAPLPFYLVFAPFPNASTYRGHVGPFSVVALKDEPVELREEILLHESLHALDILDGGGSVLARLRVRLQAIPGASPRRVHDFAHTLMFAQAAGTVRAVYDPQHRDYGDVAGYYPKVPQATAVVVPAWRAYLKGEISRDAALDKIVTGFAAAVAPQHPEKPPEKPPEKQKGDP